MLSPVFGVDATEKTFNFYGDAETEHSFSFMIEYVSPCSYFVFVKFLTGVVRRDIQQGRSSCLLKQGSRSVNWEFRTEIGRSRMRSKFRGRPESRI